jgi:hypothetical protein
MTNQNPGKTIPMDTLIARSIRLIPSLDACWYAIPLRLIVEVGCAS